VIALRAVIGVLALAAAIAGLLIPPPGVYAISGVAAIMIFLTACGAIAADALPLRVVPLLCSIATVPLAIALIAQPFSVTFYAAIILAAQAAGWWFARRAAGAAAVDSSLA